MTRKPMAYRVVEGPPESRLRLAVEAVLFAILVVLVILLVSIADVR